MRFQVLECLLDLARRGADKGFVRVSTREIGIALSRSQQTASRLLVSMESDGLISRLKAERTQKIRISPSGMDELRKLQKMLNRVFEGCTIDGIVFTGVGEGAYYMSQNGYRAQFRAKLGFDPYPGTLNLRVSTQVVQEEVLTRPGVNIEGFEAEGRSFGGGRCLSVCIGVGAWESIPAAVFIPHRTHYPGDVLELVSPENLRSKLGLRDGDRVSLRLLPCPT